MEKLGKTVTVDILEHYDRHAEVIDGELHQETSPSFEHGQAQFHVATELARFGKRGPDGKGGWWFATEVTVLYATDQGYVHDVAGWRKDRPGKKPTGSKVTERPDWVCEIVSPSNWRKDLVDKYRNLHTYGVPHYWIVDPVAMRLTVYRWHADGYLQIATFAPGDVARIEPFDALEIEVARLFGETD
jgi:Uma2 family endonuclease